MAKKENISALGADFKETLAKTNIVNIEVEQEMKKSFIAYAMAVNVSRAIPDVRDGLKPVHRRILYSMHDIGLTAEKSYKKCATIVGDVLGKFHPHGDNSVYDALVRLAQDFSINNPLVDGHGNFGSVDGDPPAAYRYTEAKMSKLASEMLRDIDKETVDFYPNFDDTRMQPTVLPARFPNLLVNGADGIAVGMATNIPPHNLGEVIDGVIAQIDNPEIDIDELISYVLAPDYPTGALIMGRNGVKQAYRTGRGSIILRAKTDIEEFNNGTRSRIVVTELPYQVNKAKLIETIADYVKDKRIEGISDINDESDRQGMRIVIDVKKDANAQVVLNTLFKHTNLQVSDGIILLALVDGEPKILNLKQIIDCYIRHQQEVITRRTRFDLAKTEEREHIISGLVTALANVDEVIAIIKKSADKNEACTNLMAAFELDDKQANAILEMRLQRLTSLEVEKLREELAELDRMIEDYKDILAKPERVTQIIKTDLLEVKEKYATPRRTEISSDPYGIEDADLIEVEDVVISMTHFGYVKRQPVSEYRAQHRGGRGITAHKPKEEDFVENMFICSTHDDILFFTNFGKVYSLKGYYIPEAQRTARGRAAVNLIQLAEGERVAAMIPFKEGTEGYIALATKNGLVKKTALTEFANIRKTGKIAISINEGDELVGVQFTSGTDELIIASEEGKCIRFSESDVRATGRDTQGVRGIELNEGDRLVDMAVIREGCEVLTISSNGFGKRSEIEDYRLQNRGGKGIRAGIFNDKTGNLVNLKLIEPGQDIMLIADTGVVIRIRSEEVSTIGRSTQGVRIMKLGEGKIATVALAPREDDEEFPEGEEVTSAEAEATNGEETPVAEAADVAAEAEAVEE
ncbi:MAG: DNA gyrase subunit A [Clostridia bacterium]|nr:DNA gyrase subunit A [Clostridia bacterium]